MKRFLITVTAIVALGAGAWASAEARGSTPTGAAESATSEPVASTMTMADHTMVSESTQPEDAFNDADVAFAQGMIPHHQDAIDMAELALDPSSEASPQVVDLATRIQAAQGPEIELMTGWLEAWGQPIEPMTSDGHESESTEPTHASDMQVVDTADGMDAPATTHGMEMTETTGGSEPTEGTGMAPMSSMDMAALDELTGEEFDEMWLASMIEHHRGAVVMAESEQAHGLNPAAIELAGQIIEAQLAEIDEMSALLGGDAAATDPPTTTS